MTGKQLLGVLLAELWFCILPEKMHPSKTETVTKFMIEWQLEHLEIIPKKQMQLLPKGII